jgi:hypothetical protein
MPAEGFRCSTQSEVVLEPLIATASHVRNWLLIEHDGPWGRDAFAHARLPLDLGSALAARAGAHGVRPLLIRRSGRTRRAPWEPAGVTGFAVHSGPHAAWIERLALDTIDAALGLDMQALGRGTSVGGELVRDPLFLVCTHGRHDPCCAERGRPLALATAAAFPRQTWECSHIGGDRFAGNLVAFPHGLYFGRAAPQDGPRIARAYREGRIDLDHYRGRSCHPMPVQAAEHLARSALGLDGVDDVGLLRMQTDDAGTTVVLATPVGRCRVRVAVDAGPAERLTCHSVEAQAPPVYRLVEMRTLSDADPDL